MDLQLAGLAAAITGGSEGIGRAVATALAAEGCDVTIGARRMDPLNQAAEEIQASTGRHVEAVQMDVTNPDQAHSFITETAERLGRLDILVNNAGTSAGAPFEDVDDDAWDADLQLKLYGAIRCARTAIPYLRAAGGGAIVNMTTPAGKQPGASTTPTSVSRAAGIALTKALSKDLAVDRIRVNTVMIGAIRSMQWERRWQSEASGESLEAYYKRSGEDLLLGRVGRAEEVADLVAFLVSPRAAYITGTAIAIDGGESDVV
jgi:NAD(P)-dependent dehydrogenase (short-subunit alcohol dehydrogenase family)